MIEIDGVVIGPSDPDTFTRQFIKWVESEGYSFAGSIGPFNEEDDE